MKLLYAESLIRSETESLHRTMRFLNLYTLQVFYVRKGVKRALVQ